MKVLEAVSSAVAAEGFDHIFGVMGDANQDLIVDLAEKHGVKFVQAHHEGVGVAMADGFARFSGKGGLATVTQGPGLTNAMTSLVAARFHRTPVLLLAGHASLGDRYNPQGVVNQNAFAMLATEAVVDMNSVKTVDYCMGEAFRQLFAKKGPFVLNLPQDIQKADMPTPDWTYRPMYKPASLQTPSAHHLDEAVALLKAAKNPTILCGLGAVHAGAAAEVQKLAEYLGAPLATSLFGNGFCADYPLYMGISGGLGSDLAVDTLADSDVMVVVGASLNEWTSHFGKVIQNGKKIIQIDIRPDAFGWFARVDVGLTGDAKATVNELLERMQASGQKARKPAPATADKIKNRKLPDVNFEDGKSIDPRRAMRYLEDKLPKDERIIVLDGGHTNIISAETISVPRNENWLGGQDFGAVGQGLGLALGACFARPGKRVTHITGDFSFMMMLADFHLAVRHKLPLTVFVFNDNAVGQEKHDLVHKKLKPSYADIQEPDFEKLAIAFGAKGFRVNNPDDLGELDKALAVEEGPVIVNININGDVEVEASWEIAQHLS